MSGRYGIDNLYYFLGIIYLLLILINIFFKNNIITIIELLLVTISIYRAFSKNINKRRKENQKYLNIKNNITKIFKNKSKYYLYRKCPKCKTTLRLPLPQKRGFHHVKCPKCKKRLTIFTHRKEKIEVIRKKAKK